jgi:hypothetical protein
VEDLFEAIKIFQEFEQLVRKKGKGQLSHKNLNIQADAYGRLAEPLDEEDEAFAFLTCDKKNRDSSLRFGVEFYKTHCVIGIEGFEPIFLGYKSEFEFPVNTTFKDEKDLARQLFLFLQLLANGQIAVLTTNRYGIPCAAELLLYSKNKITVLYTLTSYRWWWKNNPSDTSDYDCTLLRNQHSQEDELAIPSNFFLIEKNSNGRKVKQGRSIKPGNLTPLLKGVYNTTVEQMALSQFGMDDTESLQNVIYKSWEFYLLIALLGFLTYVCNNIGLLPPLLAEHWLLLLLPFFLISAFLVTFVFFTKENLHKENPNHPWFKLDHFLAKYFWQIAYATTVVMTIAITFMPNVAQKDTHKITSLFALASHYPMIYLPLPFLAISFIALFSRRRAVQLPAFVAYLAGNILLWCADAIYTDDSATTPEPYTTITVATLVLGFVFVAGSFAMRFMAIQKTN